MKKIKVVVTQTLELPDDYTIIEGKNGKFIKVNENYLMPSVEFMKSNKFSDQEMNFIELDESLCDVIYSSIVSDEADISEI